MRLSLYDLVETSEDVSRTATTLRIRLSPIMRRHVRALAAQVLSEPKKDAA